MNKFLYLLVLGAVCLHLSGCLFPSALSEHQQFIEDNVQNNPDITEHNLLQNGFNLHYRSIGTPNSAVAVWIHGTPGGWSDIGRLMLDQYFTDQVLLLSIDRPGWGRSQYLETSRAVPTFGEQARLISPLIKNLRAKYPDQPIILAGHSWGASLVPTLALANSAEVDGVLALAGPFDAKLAKPRWYNRLASTMIFNGIIGEGLRRSNDEMYALPGELRQAERDWRNLNVPIIVVQGEDDGLVPAAHIDFAKLAFEHDKASFVALRNQGHLLQIERTPLIGQCILALAKHDKADCRDTAH